MYITSILVYSDYASIGIHINLHALLNVIISPLFSRIAVTKTTKSGQMGYIRFLFAPIDVYEI